MTSSCFPLVQCAPGDAVSGSAALGLACTFVKKSCEALSDTNEKSVITERQVLTSSGLALVQCAPGDSTSS